MEIKVICGTNHFLIEEKLKRIKENSLGEVLRMEGASITKDELSVSLSSFSMFEEKKIQIIDGFLIRLIDEENINDDDAVMSSGSHSNVLSIPFFNSLKESLSIIGI